jgi:Transglycosylase SLT domain
MNSSMEMQADLGIGPQLVIMGSILGSLFVGILTYTITQNSQLGGITNDLFSLQSRPGGETLLQDGLMEEEPIVEGSLPATNEQAIQDQGECPISNKYPDSILQWCSAINQYSANYGLSPDLIAAVMLQESGGDPYAYSHSGAVGLMQIMPRDGIASSFMCVNGPCFTNRPSISELQDPDFNIEYGTRMLANLQGRYGNIRDALKSYGPMDAGYTYADKVLAIFENYQE